MKIIIMGKGVEIRTPWLTINEAAAYCNMSREKFLRAAETHDVAHGGSTGLDRGYHITALDRMMRQAGYYPPETIIEEAPEC